MEPGSETTTSNHWIRALLAHGVKEIWPREGRDNIREKIVVCKKIRP